jgi:hypothetical protein
MRIGELAMRPPLYIPKSAGSKCWALRYLWGFLGDWCPSVICEPYAATGVIGLTLLHHLLCRGRDTRLVLAEKDEDYRSFWAAALGDVGFSYRVRRWTRQVTRMPPEEQRAFVLASLDEMKHADPGFWTLLRTRVGYNGTKIGGFTGQNQQGGILGRWPADLPQSLDLLFSMRSRIRVVNDAFVALAECDDACSYSFVDSAYSVTEHCPGHGLYKHAHIDHDALLRILAKWKGRWQFTYAATSAGMQPLLRITATRISPSGAEEVVRSETGALFAVPGVDYQIVEMVTGTNRKRSPKKYEVIISRVPPEQNCDGFDSANCLREALCA